MCHLYVMSDRGAETCNGHSWQGQEVIGHMIRAGVGWAGSRLELMTGGVHRVVRLFGTSNSVSSSVHV